MAERVARHSSPAASIAATISPTPAPSEMNRLTQSCSSMIVRSRLASSAMSNGRSGTNTPWTSQRAARIVQPLGELRVLDPLVVRERGGRGQPAAVPAHHLVDDQHPRVGRMLGDDVAGEQGALLGGGPRAERLLDRHDVVVDGLGQADHRQLDSRCCAGRPRGRRRCRWCRRRRWCAGRRRRRGSAARRRPAAGPARADEAALDAILDVGELDPAVADRGAAERVQPMRRSPAPRRSPRRIRRSAGRRSRCGRR